MSEAQQAIAPAQTWNEMLEIEMPEGPEDAVTGQGALAVSSPNGKGIEGVTPLAGESLAETLTRLQRERIGTGAVYVIKLEAL